MREREETKTKYSAPKRKQKPSRKKLDLLDNEEIVDLAKPLMKKKKVSLSQLLDGLDESKFTCYYCDKMFCNRKFLNEHYKKHLDSNGTLPCKYCEKRYPSFRKITCHIRSTHDTGWSFWKNELWRVPKFLITIADMAS